MRKIKLKELASYNKGQQINGNMLLNEGKYEYLNGGINPSGKWNEYNVEGNTIAISEGGNSCGYVNYMNRNFWCGAHCYYLFNIKCNVKYLFYNLKYNERRLQNIRSGACMPNIKKKELGEFEIFIDEDIKSQNKIASYLDRISYIMQNRKKQIEELDELIKSQFVEMFENCKNIELIGEKIDICRGASPRPINNFITEDVNGENWIKIGDASENSLYITSTKEKITSEGANKSRRVYKGDFILSNSMSYGRPYILGINGCVHDGWLIMSKFQNTFNELYLYYAIRDEYVQNQFAGKVNGATVKNLNSDLVKASFIKIPPIEAQNRFAEFVKQVDKQKFEIQKSLEENKKLQESLMNKYFG